MGTDQTRRAALDRLPLPYPEALRLREAGVAGDVIAEILAIEPEAIDDTLMRIAEAKLAAAEGRDQGCPLSISTCPPREGTRRNTVR